MIDLAFFWIAPFYGFFHAPWFLAQAIVIPCDGRPLAQAIIVMLGMVIAPGGERRHGCMLTESQSQTFCRHKAALAASPIALQERDVEAIVRFGLR
jgi:hypothetical protein